MGFPISPVDGQSQIVNGVTYTYNASRNTWTRVQGYQAYGGAPAVVFSVANAAGSYANSGYAIANSGSSYANGAFRAANASSSYANGSFAKANTAATSAPYANAAYLIANSGASYANSGFEAANSASSYANGAFAQANISFENVTAASDYANSAFTHANDAFNSVSSGSSYANGAFVSANSGSTYANASFARANNVGLYANGAFLGANAASSYANSSFAASNSNASYANSGFIAANSASSYANGAFEHSNASLIHAESVYSSSNNYFRTGGGLVSTFANVSSNLSVGTYVDFNTGVANPTQVEGRVFYDNTQKALSYYNESNMTFQIGQEEVVRVYNNTGATITDGKVVYFTTSSSGGFPGIALAKADSALTSAVVGVTTTSIANNSFGYVTQRGKVNGLNTSTLTPGDKLYLSAATAGAWQTTPPATPNTAYYVARVVTSDLTNGSIQVYPAPAYGANFTTGSIFIAKDGLITQDSALFFDTTNHRLGINTQTPQANLHVAGDALFSGNVQINGNLIVSNAQSIVTTQLTVGGNTILLNSGVTGVPTSNADITVNRGTSTNVYISWDESVDEWKIYEGSGTAGHILSSEKTATSWSDYTAMDAYEKLKYPIGADLANSINETAKSASSTATSASAHAVSAYLSQNTTGVYANSGFGAANSASSYANGAFAQANNVTAASSYANGAFTKANTANSIAITSGDYANSAFANANAALSAIATLQGGTATDGWSRNAVNAASSYANSGFGVANSASSYANGAFAQANNVIAASSYANSGFGIANSASSYANGAFAQANNVTAASSYANSGFGVANSSSSYANGAFAQANNVTAAASYANSGYLQANSAYVSQNTTGGYANAAFGIANSASSYANGAFAQANNVTAASSYANSGFGVANSASSYANGAFAQANNVTAAASYANSGFGTANSASSYANSSYIAANAASSYANSAYGTANSKVYIFYQNTLPTVANTRDEWVHSDTGVKYQNINGTTPVWVELGPTTVAVESSTGPAAFDKANAAFAYANTSITTSGGTVTGQLNVTFQPATTQNTAITVTAANTKGGTGYADVLKITNSSAGATNPNKFIRITPTGVFEIVNSGYTGSPFQLTDSGDLTISGNLTMSGIQSGYSANRPGFRVTGSGTTNNLTTTQNTYGALNSNNWTVVFTQGSGLNSTTGIFTAPVTGLYQVNIVGRNSGYSSGISQLGVLHNGSSGGLVGGTCICMIEFAASSSMNHVGASTVFKLTAGDTLALKVLAGQINFDNNDNWSIAYIG